jgi:hypothetical protein
MVDARRPVPDRKVKVEVEAACNNAGVQAEGYEHRLKDFRLKAEGRSSEHFSLNTFSLST